MNTTMKMQTASGLRVKSNTKAGGMKVNHTQAASGLKVKSKVKAGGGCDDFLCGANHNQNLL